MHKTIKCKAAMLFIVGVVLSVAITGCQPGIVDQECDEFYGNIIIQWSYSVACNIGNLL